MHLESATQSSSIISLMRTLLQLLLHLWLLCCAQSFLSPVGSKSVGASFSSVLHDMRFWSSRHCRKSLTMASGASTEVAAIPSWSDLKSKAADTKVGVAMNAEVALRRNGKGSAHVQNTLRQFSSKESPKISLYRDHAGWCPYCEKTMLLIEEKEIPIKISLVPMRSYGDKPPEFMQKVPSGLLPALEVEESNGETRIITESQVIMELLDQWHPKSEGYKPMLPENDNGEEWTKVQELARLERELFSWWCTLLFRPEGPQLGRNVVNMLKGQGDSGKMSGSMKGFLDCMKKVDDALAITPGPWFLGQYDYPTMIDFIYISHIERMLASCAYWKGLNLRDPKWNFKALNAWLDAFDKREAYLAFKSDYYTNVMDIPPQYGPGYDGGFEEDREKFSKMITGRDDSWRLPLTRDDPLQPLFHGPPLPLAVLYSMDLTPDESGAYDKCDPDTMALACRHMAAWKLAGNGISVSRFAARGGPSGATNPRKSFGAQLADPYADPDDSVRPFVDAALRVLCTAMLQDDPPDTLKESLRGAVPKEQVSGVVASLSYLRDRVGVPRDLPLAAARHLRGYLNWAIGVLS